MLKIVTDGVGESDSSAIMYGRGVDTSTLELVDEGAIMIGSHAAPGSKTYLMIKY